MEGLLQENGVCHLVLEEVWNNAQVTADSNPVAILMVPRASEAHPEPSELDQSL